MNRHTAQRGLTLLVTLLLMSVLLTITASLLNITLKQFQISGIARESEMAFEAADAGIDCVLYHDLSVAGGGTFNVPGDGTEQSSRPQMTCMGATANADDTLDDNTNGQMKSGEEQRFQFDWGTPSLCTKVSVYKFYSTSADVDINNVEGVTKTCQQNFVCTIVVSHGYNNSCGNLSNLRTVERKLVQVY